MVKKLPNLTNKHLLSSTWQISGHRQLPDDAVSQVGVARRYNHYLVIDETANLRIYSGVVDSWGFFWSLFLTILKSKRFFVCVFALINSFLTKIRMSLSENNKF